MKYLLILTICFASLGVFAQGTSINTTGAAPDTSAILDVSSTTQGFLPPRMTTAERDAISGPAAGLVIFNTDVNCINVYDGTDWTKLCGCTNPDAPVALAGSGADKTEITANWNAVSGATYYELDVARDNGFTNFLSGYSALDVGTATSYNITGLGCDSTYYYRVRAISGCGASDNSNTITFSTTSCSAPFCVAIGGGSADAFNAVVSTSDGGFIAAGKTTSFGAGGEDGYIVKTDFNGNIEWTRTVGGPTTENFFSVTEAIGGGYYAAGYTNTYGVGGNDHYLVKLDATGNVLWTKTIGSTAHDSGGRGLVSTSDGGVVIVGGYYISSYDGYIVKLSAAGTVEWTRVVGGSASDIFFGVVQSADGGFVAAGHAVSYGQGGADIYVVKVDATGNVIWTRTVGGTGAERTEGITNTSDGGYVIAGRTQSFGQGGNDAYFVKLDDSGTVQWTRTVGGTGQDYAYGVVETSDGGYLSAGYTDAFGGGFNDGYVVKLDASGNLDWTKTVGKTGEEIFWGVAAFNGGIVLCGHTESIGSGGMDGYLVTIDELGNGCCTSGSGGVAGSGGTSSSGGNTATGVGTGSGGTSSSGGVLTIDCN